MIYVFLLIGIVLGAAAFEDGMDDY